MPKCRILSLIEKCVYLIAPGTELFKPVSLNFYSPLGNPAKGEVNSGANGFSGFGHLMQPALLRRAPHK
jgi:hypothetical protein